MSEDINDVAKAALALLHALRVSTGDITKRNGWPPAAREAAAKVMEDTDAATQALLATLSKVTP